MPVPVKRRSSPPPPRPSASAPQAGANVKVRFANPHHCRHAKSAPEFDVYDDDECEYPCIPPPNFVDEELRAYPGVFDLDWFMEYYGIPPLLRVPATMTAIFLLTLLFCYVLYLILSSFMESNAEHYRNLRRGDGWRDVL